MEPIATVINGLLHDELITSEDQLNLRAAIQACNLGHTLVLWVTCPRRRALTGRQMVKGLAERMGQII